MAPKNFQTKFSYIQASFAWFKIKSVQKYFPDKKELQQNFKLFSKSKIVEHGSRKKIYYQYLTHLVQHWRVVFIRCPTFVIKTRLKLHKHEKYCSLGDSLIHKFKLRKMSRLPSSTKSIQCFPINIMIVTVGAQYYEEEWNKRLVEKHCHKARKDGPVIQLFNDGDINKFVKEPSKRRVILRKVKRKGN